MIDIIVPAVQYIMILITPIHGSTSSFVPTSIVFSSQATCQSAKDSLLREWHTKNPAKWQTSPLAVCVEK